MSLSNVPRKTQTRATKALEKIRKMRAEWKAWQGKAPTVVRVSMGDFLALTECGYVRDGKLSGDGLEVKPG